jgi:hypothetical protein
MDFRVFGAGLEEDARGAASGARPRSPLIVSRLPYVGALCCGSSVGMVVSPTSTRTRGWCWRASTGFSITRHGVLLCGA